MYTRRCVSTIHKVEWKRVYVNKLSFFNMLGTQLGWVIDDFQWKSAQRLAGKWLHPSISDNFARQVEQVRHNGETFLNKTNMYHFERFNHAVRSELTTLFFCLITYSSGNKKSISAFLTDGLHALNCWKKTCEFSLLKQAITKSMAHQQQRCGFIYIPPRQMCTIFSPSP